MAREFTHPDVLTIGVAAGWAEPETDPARIDWPSRQAVAAIPFRVAGGRPVNPCAKTGIERGRNLMGFWGENLMTDALVTATVRRGTPDRPAGRYLLMIQRDDGLGWAVPGGRVEPGESVLRAALRELEEETGLRESPEAVIPAGRCRLLPPCYVPDPRSSDEAWAVTAAAHLTIGDRLTCRDLPPVRGGDDARRAEWVPAREYPQMAAAVAAMGGTVFAAHVPMLAGFLAGDAR